jgi:hypothetical protein
MPNDDTLSSATSPRSVSKPIFKVFPNSMRLCGLAKPPHKVAYNDRRKGEEELVLRANSFLS